MLSIKPASFPLKKGKTKMQKMIKWIERKKMTKTEQHRFLFKNLHLDKFLNEFNFSFSIEKVIIVLYMLKYLCTFMSENRIEKSGKRFVYKSSACTSNLRTINN